MATPPLVVLLGTTGPEQRSLTGAAPAALRGPHGQSLADGWCVHTRALSLARARALARQRPASPQHAARARSRRTRRPRGALCRWRVLGAAGLDDPALAYVVTNAAHYKAFEFWAFGRGLALPHVINSGRSVGDAR